MESPGDESHPSKVGAGLLFCCGAEVLVLLRSSVHNFNTWGLPGGNAEETDGSNLLATAIREATEEMTTLPEHTVLEPAILTKRGKRKQKHYTVFVCSITPEVKATYCPKLNYEHSAARWFDAQQLQQQENLHPVTKLLLTEHWEVLSGMLGLARV